MISRDNIYPCVQEGKPANFSSSETGGVMTATPARSKMVMSFFRTPQARNLIITPGLTVRSRSLGPFLYSNFLKEFFDTTVSSGSGIF